MKKSLFDYFRKHILYVVKDTYPQKRKHKYSFEYYLQKITLMLNDFNIWPTLQYTCVGNSSYHWKSIYNVFLKWSKDKIFEKAFYNFIKDYYFKISKVKQNKKINLFIDVTKIVNKLGSKGISIDGENKKKNVTPLTVICNQNKLPLCVNPIENNKTIYNGRNTSKHEIKNVQNTLDKINFFSINKYININLIGDKAYISNQTYNVMNREVKIIYPKKKNQKTKNTLKEKNLLKKRHNIENVFATIKKNNRVMIRKDKNIETYMSFVYLSLFETHLLYADRNNLL